MSFFFLSSIIPLTFCGFICSWSRAATLIFDAHVVVINFSFSAISKKLNLYNILMMLNKILIGCYWVSVITSSLLLYFQRHITNPRTEQLWKLDDNGVTIQYDTKIAERFNEFFVNKIEKLKANVDVNPKDEPLKRLAKRDRIIAGIGRRFVFFRGSRETRQPRSKN